MTDGPQHMSLLDRESRGDDCGDNIGIHVVPEPDFRTIFLPLDRPDTSNPGEATAPPPRRPTFRNIVHERDIAEDFHPHTQPPKTPSGEERVVGENGAQLITTHYRSKLPSEYVKKPNSNGAANAEGSEPSASSTVTASSSAAGKASQPSDDRAKDCQKPISGKNPPSSQDAAAAAVPERHHTERLSSFAIRKGQGDPFDRFREKLDPALKDVTHTSIPEGAHAIDIPKELHTVASLTGKPMGETFRENHPTSPAITEPDANHLHNRSLNFSEEIDRMNREERLAHVRHGGSGFDGTRSDGLGDGHSKATSPHSRHLQPPISRHNSMASSSLTPTIPSTSPSPLPPHSGSSVSPSPPPSSSDLNPPTNQRCPLSSPDDPDGSLPRPSHGFPLRPVAFHPTAPLSHHTTHVPHSAPPVPRSYDLSPSAASSHYRLHVAPKSARTSTDYSHSDAPRPTLRPSGSVPLSQSPPPLLRPVGALSTSRSFPDQSSSRTLPPPSGHRYYPSPAFAPAPDAYIAPPTFSALHPARPGQAAGPYLPPGSRPHDRPGAGLAIRTESMNRTKRRSIHSSPRKEAAMYGLSRQGSSKGKEIALEEYVEDEDDESDPYSSGHYRTTTGDGKPPKPKRKHPCSWPGCDKTFTRSGDVDRHIVHVHQKFLAKEQDHPTRCEICGRVLSRKDSAKRHMMSKACGKRKLKSEQGDGIDEEDEYDVENEHEIPP